MWPFRKTKLHRAEDFPAVIDMLAEKLRSAHFVVEADHLHRLAPEFVATPSSETYGELQLVLQALDHEHRALPREIASEVRRLIKSIDKIAGRR